MERVEEEQEAPSGKILCPRCQSILAPQGLVSHLRGRKHQLDYDQARKEAKEYLASIKPKKKHRIESDVRINCPKCEREMHPSGLIPHLMSGLHKMDLATAQKVATPILKAAPKSLVIRARAIPRSALQRIRDLETEIQEFEAESERWSDYPTAARAFLEQSKLFRSERKRLLENIEKLGHELTKDEPEENENS